MSHDVLACPSHNVRLLDSPLFHNDRPMCVAIIESRRWGGAEQMAHQVARQLRSTPFEIAALAQASSIVAPWPQRGALKAALLSLLTPPRPNAGQAIRCAQIDRNTISSLVTYGGGLRFHLLAARRKWRFSRFILIEEFGLLSMKWTALADVDTQPRSSIVLRGGLNTPTERRHMVARLVQGTELNLNP